MDDFTRTRNYADGHDLPQDLRILRLSRWVLERRRAMGLTQGEVADAIGVSQQCVQRWEKGKSVPSFDNLPGLARLFGKDALAECLFDVDDSTEGYAIGKR